MSSLSVPELPSERTAVRRRQHRGGRAVEEDPWNPFSLLHLRETEGGNVPVCDEKNVLLTTNDWTVTTAVLKCTLFLG